MKFCLETYTIRRHIKSESSLRDSLQKVKNIGIRHLELASVKFSIDNIEHIVKICKEFDVSVCGTQMEFGKIKKNLTMLGDMHEMLRCSNCCISLVSFKNLNGGADALKKYAEILNQTGRKLKDSGINLLFHHHHFEFLKADGRLVFDILRECTDPRFVNFTIDTYWAQRGGMSPPDFIQSLAGRVKVVHLRDFKLRPPIFMPRISDCEIGEGNLDIKKIIEACKNAGVETLALEQESQKPFESIKISVDYLKKLGFNDFLFN